MENRVIEYENNKYVFSYNNDQYKRTKFFCKEGDEIEWKRNGQRGCVKAVIIGFNDTKPKQVLVQDINHLGAGVGNPKWINKNSVLRVIT